MNPNWNDALEQGWRRQRSPQNPPSTSTTTVNERNKHADSLPGRASTADIGQRQERFPVSSKFSASSDVAQQRGGAKSPMMLSSPTSGRAQGIRGSRSAQGLATVGLGNFKIGALHEAIQGGCTAENQNGGLFPGGLGVPQSFQGRR